MQFKLIKKIEEAPDTFSYFFESETKFDFKAGQFVYLTLPKLNYPDERGATRHFTISSSPTEDLIRITTRIRQESGYKKTLNELTVGSTVEARGPFGTFVIDDHQAVTSNIFLAGGIGITPFRSMIKYNIDIKNLHGLKIPMHLIYSNSDGNFVFKKELDEMQNEKDYIHIEYVDTSLVGRINKLKIKSAIENWNLKIENCVFLIVGPNSFVDAMESVLLELGLNEDKIKSEKFTGY